MKAGLMFLLRIKARERGFLTVTDLSRFMTANSKNGERNALARENPKSDGGRSVPTTRHRSEPAQSSSLQPENDVEVISLGTPFEISWNMLNAHSRLDMSSID